SNASNPIITVRMLPASLWPLERARWRAPGVSTAASYPLSLIGLVDRRRRAKEAPDPRGQLPNLPREEQDRSRHRPSCDRQRLKEHAACARIYVELWEHRRVPARPPPCEPPQFARVGPREA